VPGVGRQATVNSMDKSDLKFDDKGLIPAVVQDAASLQVLMVAWMNEESLRLTQETAETHFWSRSRQALWHKGATSGNVQRVREIRFDCDGDTLLLLVDAAGPACHTGERSCFFRKLDKSKLVNGEPLIVNGRDYE
jgi:phosphoribosyl-AMP cyclohydrolase